jgi:hypothetical protein
MRQRPRAVSAVTRPLRDITPVFTKVVSIINDTLTAARTVNISDNAVVANL